MNEEETGKSFLLLAVFNVLLLAAVFVIGWRQHRNGGGGWDPCASSLGGCSESAGAMGPVVSIEDMMVQLQPYEDDRYVRLSLGLEVDGETTQMVVTRRTSELRDVILRTFSEHKPEDLQGSAGLAELKKSLMEQFRELVPGKRIRNIYVTQFAIM